MARRPSSVRPSVNFCANRFFSQTNGQIATKLAHDGLQVSVHPGCAQGQGQGQRSRDMRTFLDFWNELLCHWRSGYNLLRLYAWQSPLFYSSAARRPSVTGSKLTVNGVARKFFRRGSKSRGSFPSFPARNHFPLFSLPLLRSHFPPLLLPLSLYPLPPLRSRTHKIQLGNQGESCELPQRGFGRSPCRNRI